MITEWKRCAKLIKYGYNLKSSVAAAAIFFVLGIVMCVLSPDEMFSLGGMYIVLGPMLLIQCVYTSLSAGISMSSPRRRFIETWFHDGLQLLIGLAGYALVILIAVIQISHGHSGAEERAALGQAILYTGMLTGVLMIYMGIVYKTFLLSVLLFLVAFVSLMAEVPDKIFGFMQSVTVAKGILWGLAAIAIGAVISGLLRRMLYKKPLSKFSIRTNFWK